MANKLESIPTVLGNMRTGLVDQGFTSDQAFWLIQDLIRKGDSPEALLSE